jgi:aryl-alcohol dehydrogenase-like predicted oxidoreductase
VPPALAQDMDLTRLGNSGLTVSRLGLGCNNFAWRRLDKAESIPVLRGALEAGVTLFDTSDSYGDSEIAVGEAFEGHRDEVVIATKFGSDLKGANGPDFDARGSRRYIRTAVERSLRRLRTDHIDLYQLHRPDALTPIHETLSALNELVQEGKVRYIGSSNFAGWQVADAEWTSRTHHLERFVSAQNNYNLIERDIEADLVPACEAFGIGILPFFPLASGLLTGKYTRGETAPKGTRYGEWGLQATRSSMSSRSCRRSRPNEASRCSTSRWAAWPRSPRWPPSSRGRRQWRRSRATPRQSPGSPHRMTGGRSMRSRRHVASDGERPRIRVTLRHRNAAIRRSP